MTARGNRPTWEFRISCFKPEWTDYYFSRSPYTGWRNPSTKPLQFHANDSVMAYSPLSTVKLVDCWTTSISSVPSCSSWTFSSADQERKETLYLLMYLNTVLKFLVFFLGNQMKRPYTPIRNDPMSISRFLNFYSFQQRPEEQSFAINQG